MQAVRGEMWRGAKLAFKIVLIAYYGLVAALIVTGILWQLGWGHPGGFAQFFQRLTTLEGLQALKVFGNLLCIVFVVPSILFLWCVILASPMIGVCVAVRWRPSPVHEEPSEKTPEADPQLKQ